MTRRAAPEGVVSPRVHWPQDPIVWSCESIGVDDSVFLEYLTERLRPVNGLEAIVLGGSRARGTHDAFSDYDLGLYYRGDFDFPHLRAVAEKLDGRPDAVVPKGEWGPWMDGGGWLRVMDRRVDLLYRNLETVEDSVERAQRGSFDIHYQAGHPFGFLTSTYAAEVALCRSLWDPKGAISGLPKSYPEPLVEALTHRFGWEAAFCLDIAVKPQQRNDTAYLCGCLFRQVMCLCQVLYARERRWWLNEKGAVREAATFPSAPKDFAEKAHQVSQGDLPLARLLLEDVLYSS